MIVIELVIVGIRFLLEVCTVVGLIYGGFRANKLSGKISYLILAGLIVVVWMFFGAPKSTHALVGMNKVFLESGIFLIGSIACSFIFNKKIGSIYFTVAVIDTILLHFLNL